MQIGGVVGVIKNVQRGTIVMGSGSSSGTATISAVNVAKSELRLLGVYSGFNSDMCGYLALTNSTTITASRNGVAGSSSFSYELTEYN